MKRIFIPLSILLFIVVGLFTASFIVPWEHYKDVVINSIKSATGREVVVNGKVTGSLLPLPHITIADIRVKNAPGSSTESMVEAKSLEVEIRLLPLLQGKMEVAAITLGKARVQLEILENGKENWDFSDVSSPSGKNNITFDTINLVDSEVVIRKNSSQFVKSFNKTNASLNFDSLTGPFILDGNFTENKEKITFSAHTGKIVQDKDVVLSGKLTMPYIEFAFEGNYIKKDKASIVSGKLSASIQNVKKSLDKFIGNFSYTENIKAETITATADASFTGKEFSLENIAIHSPSIIGSGRIKTSFYATPVVDAIINFDSINIDTLQAPVKGTQGEEIKARGAQQPHVKYSEISFPKSVNALIYLTIKKMTYHGKDIENTILNTDLFNGTIEIYPSTAQLPDNAKLELSGSISSNGIRPAFDGSFAASGQNLNNTVAWLGFDTSMLPLGNFTKLDTKFDIKTEVSITPKELRLSNMDIATDEMNIAGLFNIRHGSGIPEINTNLTLSTLNLDNPIIVTKGTELLQPFISKGIDESGTDFLWLRKFPIRLGAEITVADLQYNQRAFKNPLFIFHVEPGSLKFDRITVDAELAALDAEVGLDIRALRPQISLNLKGERLDMAIFSLPEKKKNQDGAALPKNAVAPPLFLDTKDVDLAKTDPAKRKWSTEEFDFLRLDKFSGTMHAALNEFKYQNIPVEKLTAAVRLSDGVVVIENLRGDIFNGKLLAKGGVGITPPSISLAFSLSNAMLDHFLTSFTSIDTVSGYFSLSGSFSMQGTSPQLWASGLETGVSLAVRDMKVKNFDLHRIVDSADAETLFSKESFALLTQEATNTGETLFRNVDGKMTASQGIMQVSNLKFDTLRTSGVMAGSLDIKNWLINMVSQIAFIPESSNKLTLPIGLTLTGPIESPEKKVDTKELLTYLLKKAPPVDPVVIPANQNISPENMGWETPAAASGGDGAVSSSPAVGDAKPQPITLPPSLQ